MKKRIISMALALVMMLSLCVITVSAEETVEAASLVYYDLQEQATGSLTGNISTYWNKDTTPAGGFIRRENWSSIKVTGSTSKTIAFGSAATTGGYIFNRFGFLVEELNQDADYSVPLRKVTMSFKTSATVSTLYDKPVALWFNLFAVSKKGILALDDSIHTMSADLRAAVEKCENDTDMILFWWTLPNMTGALSTEKSNAGTIYPIAKIGTVGQTSYTDSIEYIYELVGESTVNAKQIKIGDTVKDTLLDGSTPFNGLTFTPKYSAHGGTLLNNMFWASSLRPDFETKCLDHNGTETEPRNLVQMIGCARDSSKNTTTLTFNQLKYEGVEQSVEIEETAPAVAENTLSTTVTVANDTYAPLSGNIIFAAYSGNVLVGVDIEPISVSAAAGSVDSKDLSITNEAIGGDGEITYKVMLLDSMNKLVPLVSANDGTVAK